MKSFFSSFFAALLAILVFSIGGVMLLIGFAAAFSSDVEVTVPTNAVLVIDLNDNFTEKEVSDPFTELMNPGTGKIPSLTSVIGLIQHAKKIQILKVFILSVNKIQMGTQVQRNLERPWLILKK